jgi:hypothetical protein
MIAIHDDPRQVKKGQRAIRTDVKELGQGDDVQHERLHLVANLLELGGGWWEFVRYGLTLVLGRDIPVKHHGC